MTLDTHTLALANARVFERPTKACRQAVRLTFLPSRERLGLLVHNQAGQQPLVSKQTPAIISFTAARDALYASSHMALTDREKEELKVMIDGGEPIPPKYRAVLFANPHEAELIWPGKTSEITGPPGVNR